MPSADNGLNLFLSALTGRPAILVQMRPRGAYRHRQVHGSCKLSRRRVDRRLQICGRDVHRRHPYRRGVGDPRPHGRQEGDLIQKAARKGGLFIALPLRFCSRSSSRSSSSRSRSRSKI